MKPQSNIHVVMLIDAWFPSEVGMPGVYGSSQVHVQNVRRILSEKHDCRIELFFPANPNIIVRTLWPLVVLGQVIYYARTHQIDIFHTHGLSATISGKILSLLLNIPIVTTIHGSRYLDNKTNSLLHKLEKKVYTQTHYDAQVTVARCFLEHSNVNTNVHYIANGVDVGKFSKIKVSKSSLPTIIWVGRAHASKGIDILKKAIVKIRKKIPNLQATLITGGEMTGDALIKAYKSAHVFVLPSLSEGQPISLLEAWAAKLPVVATDTGDSTNLIKDGVNGYLVEPGNTQQLANATLKVLRAKVADQRMAEAGFQLVKKEFSWKKTAKKTYAIYQSLLQ
jgi:glycosyltransferase involved in cell wall biosynthesis